MMQERLMLPEDIRKPTKNGTAVFSQLMGREVARTSLTLGRFFAVVSFFIG